jgi:uncharacterized LabA/DUF88 family protein
MPGINIYIDGNNLHRGAKSLGFELDYKKFKGWLRQKFDANETYLFIGFVPERASFYNYLRECGFLLIFKQTVSVDGKVKGNCDAELVLKTVSDFYLKSFASCILVTGDGDFGCLVEFLRLHSSINRVLSPDKDKCSFLLRNKNTEMTFLNEHYPKFSRRLA